MALLRSLPFFRVLVKTVLGLSDSVSLDWLVTPAPRVSCLPLFELVGICWLESSFDFPASRLDRIFARQLFRRCKTLLKFELEKLRLSLKVRECRLPFWARLFSRKDCLRRPGTKMVSFWGAFPGSPSPRLSAWARCLCRSPGCRVRRASTARLSRRISSASSALRSSLDPPPAVATPRSSST